MRRLIVTDVLLHNATWNQLYIGLVKAEVRARGVSDAIRRNGRSMVELGLSWCTSIVRASRRLTYRSGVPDNRAVLTNGHTEHVPRAPDFFLRGPQLAVVK